MSNDLPPENVSVPAAADSPGPVLTTEDLISRLNMLDRSQPVVLGVSGGSDSVALMRLAEAWQSRPDAACDKVTVLTVDHRLREASCAEAAKVRQWAGALGFDHETLVWAGPKPEHGLAARARDARYSLMTEWCLVHGAGQLLVAHTLDDQAETVLMRLCRGSGVDGLSAMAPVTMLNGVAIIRPLLDVSRAQLRHYLEGIGQSWIDDPTNEDTAFERVRVRTALESLGPLGLTPRYLAQTARRLQRARHALDTMASRAMQDHVEAYACGYCRIDNALLAAQPEEVVLRVFSRCITAVSGSYYPPRPAALEALCAQLQGGDVRTRTLGGCQIQEKGGHLLIVREPGRVPPEPLELTPGQRAVWDRRFTVGYDVQSDMAERRIRLSVRPLLAQGWAEMKQYGYDCPRPVREGLVSFWQDDAVVAVPHLAFRSDRLDADVQIIADFCNFPLLNGARTMINADRL